MTRELDFSICHELMKSGVRCQLNTGHSGYCRHHGVWTCDGCSRQRYGAPAAQARDGEYPDGLRFCMVCMAKAERAGTID